MGSINQMTMLLILLWHISSLACQFVPDRTDYDAYGVKIAMNEKLLIQANNAGQLPHFYIRFAPYDSLTNVSQCQLNYPNLLDDFVYSVAVGKKSNVTQTQFFYIGESINSTNQPFIGVITYDSTITLLNGTNTCANAFSYSIEYLDIYTHQEHYVVGIEPNGLVAYGFAKDFIFIYDTQKSSPLESWNSASIWPNNSFMPQAIEISDNFGIIAGFIKNDPSERVKYSPIVYLLNFNASNRHPYVVDVFRPLYTPNTWQDLLTNEDEDIYSPKYDMSISINSRGDVLAGMQFINRVFLLSVNISYPRQLINISRNTNGRSLGNGKNVAWLDDGSMAAILVNTYSLSYEWSASSIYIYNITSGGYTSDTNPTSVFPNYHQFLPSMFSPVFLNIVSSPSSLVLMDIEGNLLIFNPTSPGFFPSVPTYGSIPLITSPAQCLAGMYKDRKGIHDCSLCPPGTKNSGNSSTQCTSCSSGSMCPLGSIADIPQSALRSVKQVIAYPISPESEIFDEILLRNEFAIHSGRCLVLSPLFWSLIVAGIAVTIMIIIGIMHFCIVNPKSTRVEERMRWFFKKTDLIGEGKLCVGGLASFSLIVIVCFAYTFSDNYLHQYPIEAVSDSDFACDRSLRNAKFETGLHSRGIPRSQSEQVMFTLLNEQNLTLTVDFINTLIKCSTVSLQGLFGRTWSTIRWLTCNDTNAIVSLVIPLPLQHMSVEIDIDDVQSIGGMRIGLSGSEQEEELHYRKELNTFESFSKDGSVLAQTLPVVMTITKVINETALMDSEENNYTGIYVPTYETDPNSFFLTEGQYVRSVSTGTVFTISISETPYYVKNRQIPIARRGEIIFHNLLFTVVCLEIFGLVFLMCKLILEPLFHLICRCVFCRHKNYKANEKVKDDGFKSIGESVNDQPMVASL